MNKKVMVAISLVLAYSSAYAYSENANNQAEGKNNYFMARFDSNGDNQVTKEEFLSSAAQRFQHMDVNGDKSITLSEFLQRYADFQGNSAPTADKKSDPGMHFKENDANHDGAVNQEEYMKAAQQHAADMFSKKDRNGDKQLSKEEYASFQHNSAKHTAAIAPMPEKVFAKLDADGDKKVTETEYTESRNKWFAELDKNRDGKISVEETNQQ